MTPNLLLAIPKFVLPVAAIIAAVVIIAIIVAICKKRRKQSPTDQAGNVGEQTIANLLKQCGGTVFNSYMLVDKWGNSHEIDHILVNQKGVFVVETKNYKGDIYGNADDEQWTQVLQGGKIKNNFYSPVMQNASHVNHIQRILPVNTRVYNCIVFVQDNTAHISADNVFTKSQLLEFVKAQHSEYNRRQVKELCDILNENKATNVSHSEHVDEVNRINADIDNNICPRCGKPLVLRYGENGTFYRCSDYPDCTFSTRNQQ